MNEHEKDRIAAAFHQLRPDWPAKSLRTLLDKPGLCDRARRDVVVALGWVACESNTATPARILEAGPWWKAAGVEGTLTRRHPSPEQACRNCGHEYRPGRAGYGGVIVGTCCDNPTQRPSSSDYPTQAQRARVLLHSPEETP